jgi:hypothetical protein
MANWTESSTVSTPRSITIRYVTQDGNPSSVTLTSTDTSQTDTTFRSVQFTDDNGMPDVVEVVTQKKEVRRSTQAAVNGALVASRLSFGLGLPGGDAITEITTSYEIDITSNGPVLASESSETKITTSELAGSLAVPSYEVYTPGTALFTSTIREIQHDTVFDEYGRASTQTQTSTWIAYGLTQEGQQSFAEQMRQVSGAAEDESALGGIISSAVESMKELVFQGTEVQVNTGRVAAPIKPSDSSLIRNQINNGDTGRNFATGQVTYFSDVINSIITSIKNYTMPFAPDDFYNPET